MARTATLFVVETNERLIGESAKTQQLELEFMAARHTIRREISVPTLGRRILDVAPYYLRRLHPWQAISSLGTQAAFVFTVRHEMRGNLRDVPRFSN